MIASMEDMLSPADLSHLTQVTKSDRASTVLSVRTPRPWNREDFFAWLEVAMRETTPPIAHHGELADRAGISPSTISNWKNNKQRPTMATLNPIADALGVPRRNVWLIAGILDDPEARLEAPNHEPSAADRWGVDIINQSKVSATTKQRLITVFLEGEKRRREETRLQLIQSIELIQGEQD